MIKTIFKLFYNNILSICYDTKKYTQDDIIIDLNEYDNIDYKIQKKTDFYNDDFFEYDLIKKNNNKSFFHITDNKELVNTINNQENILSDIENENSYDDCKSKEDISDIDDKYDKLTDFD